jgi:hypothetical protein
MILYDIGFFEVHAFFGWGFDPESESEVDTMIKGFAIATSEGDEEFPFFE